MERTRYRYSEIIIEKNLPLLGHIIYNLLIACVCGCGSARPSRQTDRQPGSLGGREGEVVCSGPWDWTIRCKCVYSLNQVQYTHRKQVVVVCGRKTEFQQSSDQCYYYTSGDHHQVCVD